MSKFFWKSLLVGPAALGAVVAVSGAAMAAEAAPASDAASVDALESVSFDAEPVQLAQITNVSELTDVSPSDWAYQALANLVNNYGCIQGYPDRTFRGQRSLTRFEFAAGLNACMNVLAQLIADTGLDPDDLAAIRRLQEEFAAELATLRGRVDALEADTAELRAQQFSTTTKLRGQVDMHLATPFDDLVVFDANNNPVVVEDSTSVAARARLNFDSSFTGEDRLRIRLQAGEGNVLTPFGGLANAFDANNNDVVGFYNVAVDDFYYSFPLGSRLDVTVSARGLQGDDWVTSTIVPFDGPSVADAGGPQFYDAGGSSSNGAGAGFSFALTDNFVLDAGYTAANRGATDPAVGLFSANGQSYIAQLSYLSDGFLDAAFTYMHSDQSENFVGSTGPGAVNTYAGLVNLDFGNFFIAGYGAWQDFEGGDDFNWTAGVGFNDLFIEGAQLGVYGGQLPQTVFTGSLGQQIGSDANPWLIEGYYEIPFNEFLTITPAVIYGDANFINPGGTVTEDSTVYGVVRATFRF
jgi:hypothetical protein